MDLGSGFFCNINIDLNSQCKKAGTQHKAGAPPVVAPGLPAEVLAPRSTSPSRALRGNLLKLLVCRRFIRNQRFLPAALERRPLDIRFSPGDCAPGVCNRRVRGLDSGIRGLYLYFRGPDILGRLDDTRVL